MSPKKQPKSSDGLMLLGREKGQLKYQATLRKKHRGKLIVDTTRIILADSKAKALLAKEKLLDELVQVKLGKRAATRMRFGKAVEEWLATLRAGTRRPYSSHMRKFESLGVDRYVDELTTQELQRVIATAKVGESTAAQIRNCVTAFFTWAKEQGYVGENVARGTQRPKRRKTGAELLAELEQQPRRKDMTAKQLYQFLLALRDENPDYYVMAGTQFHLGCRFAEVSALRWKDIDEQGGVDMVTGQYEGELGVTKNGKRRAAAFGPEWMEVLRAHRARLHRLGRPGAAEYCFPAKPHGRRKAGHYFYVYQTVRKAFHRAFSRAGVELDAVTHSLRHTMITLAQVEGHALAAQYLTGGRPQGSLLQEFVGHASPEMTQIYTHVPKANLVDFAAAFEKRVRAKAGVGEKVGDAGDATNNSA